MMSITHNYLTPKLAPISHHSVFIFSLSSHCRLDLQGHADYFAGQLEDYEYPEEEAKIIIAALPDFDRLS